MAEASELNKSKGPKHKKIAKAKLKADTGRTGAGRKAQQAKASPQHKSSPTASKSSASSTSAPSIVTPESKHGSKRRITTASFRPRRKRRKAERTVARTKINHSFRIFNRSIGIIWRHWEVFGGITLIYVLLNILLVGSGIVGTGDLQAMKENLSDLVSGQFAQVAMGLSLFGFLVQSGAGVANGAASAYQSILLIIVSLVFVWALRQLYANNKIRIRDAFYNATYPLVQVVLVLLMVGLHLVPAFVGTFLFGTLVTGGILIVVWQQVLVTFISFLLITWSAYLLCASVFAFYIVTLPDMTPLAALRTAKGLVRYRRGTVLRKILYLPIMLLGLSVIIMAPVATLLTPVATIVFFLLTTLYVPVVHSYMYTLYRELIQE